MWTVRERQLTVGHTTHSHQALLYWGLNLFVIASILARITKRFKDLQEGLHHLVCVRPDGRADMVELARSSPADRAGLF